jgi:hypothetical protein
MFDKLRSLLGKSKEPKQPTPSPSKRTSPPSGQTIDKIPSPALQQPPVSATPPMRPRVQPVSAPEVDLMLGVDFGTSCTKVVIGDHGWKGQSYAVPVGSGGNGLDRFLRATQVKAGRNPETNLKMRLMEAPDSPEVRDLVAFYVAGIIRNSLQWFSTDGPRQYAGRTPVWSLNLGFPAKQIEGGSLVQAYREIGEVAARLGTSDLPLNLDAVRSLRDSSEIFSSSRLIPSERIELYPEIAAQLAGYINSPYRAQGNLILIDVGAGTLDVSTAILHGNDEEDVMSFHFCEVGPFGALKLLEARMAALEAVAPGSVTW